MLKMTTMVGAALDLSLIFTVVRVRVTACQTGNFKHTDLGAFLLVDPSLQTIATLRVIPYQSLDHGNDSQTQNQLDW